MARVADYVILQDDWVQEVHAPTNPVQVKFNVPDNVHTGSRSVLTFMHEGTTSLPLEVNVHINGIVVWTFKTTGSFDAPMRLVQEVVEANILKPGENLLQWHSNGNWSYNAVSDIVLWVQVET